MPLLSRFLRKFFPPRPLAPDAAYDQWAEGYDAQPGNIVMKMDEELFSSLMQAYNLEGQSIADIGCGTGRHWEKLMAQRPAQLTGFDVSAGMLRRLKEKFPAAKVYHYDGCRLPQLGNQSCGWIISTLTMAHIENPEPVLQEWKRVLKPGGFLYITDFHPAILAQGGQRSFKKENKTFVVKNYIHSVETILQLAGQPAFTTIRYTERLIDDTLQPFYAAQNALHLFEAFKNQPLVYALLLKKQE